MHPETELENKHRAVPSRRSWRRSRISIPERTSSLSRRPRKTRERPRSRRPDSISIHNQSCKLFSSIDELMLLNRETPPPRYSEATSRPKTCQHSELHRYEASEKVPMQTPNVSGTPALRYYSVPASRRDSGYSEGQVNEARPAYNTVMSWTSDETRRREYEKIDRAHTGWRGFVNQIVPRSWKHGRRNFFHEADDDDSIRRFRMSLPEKPAREARKWTCF